MRATLLLLLDGCHTTLPYDVNRLQLASRCGVHLSDFPPTALLLLRTVGFDCSSGSVSHFIIEYDIALL